jgi:hypothetical protein
VRNLKDIIQDIDTAKSLDNLYLELGKAYYTGLVNKTKRETRVTSKGYTWTKINSEWKDETSGLIWKDEEVDTYNYNEAIAKFGNSLPTKEEYEQAELHGIREVLSFNKDYYWSASVYSLNRANAWIFNGANGNVSTNNRNLNYSVRCIAR